MKSFITYGIDDFRNLGRANSASSYLYYARKNGIICSTEDKAIELASHIYGIAAIIDDEKEEGEIIYITEDVPLYEDYELSSEQEIIQQGFKLINRTLRGPYFSYGNWVMQLYRETYGITINPYELPYYADMNISQIIVRYYRNIASPKLSTTLNSVGFAIEFIKEVANLDIDTEYLLKEVSSYETIADNGDADGDSCEFIGGLINLE